MAYLRNETEKLEIDYPLEKIWAEIPEVVKILEWTIDDASHEIKVKTKGGFLAYGSIMNIAVTSADEKTTCMSMTAETPVTTITSIIDFGRTRDRMGQFIEILAKQMEQKK
jgi:hypothetical protein